MNEWAAKHRVIPAGLTTKPGKYDPEYMPYWKEICDAMSAGSAIRKLAVRKAAQVGATTALGENLIGYTIDHDPSGFIYLSADRELVRLGVQLKVDRMLEHSGLRHKLSASGGITKRSGDTALLKEFPGGFLLAVGARNPGKLRSTSAKRMFLDEIDGMPLLIGQIGSEEGSPVSISEKRTATYESTRTILYVSTPLNMATSQINPLFLRGDQRYYYVPCVHCNHMQPLDWHGHNEDGTEWGIVFDLDDEGILIEESVGYQCRGCLKKMHDYDKIWFLPRGEWRPHARTQERGLASWHVPAFLSPPGTYSWTGSVYKWLRAWDVENDRVKDIRELREFWNLERGLPWEERGESVPLSRVKDLRRQTYRSGKPPNELALKETGAPIVLLTCTVDTHRDRLDVLVTGWCVGRQSYSVLWKHFEGDVDDVDGDSGPWAQLRKLLEETTFVADDGRRYGIRITLIDCGYKAERVHAFCSDYSSGVFPIMGRDDSVQGSLHREFSEFISQWGTTGFNVTASMYKDRLNGWLKREWKVTDRTQPVGFCNFPTDYPDDFFDELVAEERVPVLNARTRKKKGLRWEQKGQQPNHAWDCLVYAACALDMIAIEYCFDRLGLDQLNYDSFFAAVAPRRDDEGNWIAGPFSAMEGEITC